MKHTRSKKEKNSCGKMIRKIRIGIKPPVSQDDLSGRLAAIGVTIDQGAISRIESQTRYLMDYELIAIARSLRVDVSVLLPIKTVFRKK
jgi:hypothetical protein